jgi:hypothetical protein
LARPPDEQGMLQWSKGWKCLAKVLSKVLAGTAVIRVLATGNPYFWPTKANTHVNRIDTTFARTERTVGSVICPCSSTMHGQCSGDPVTVAAVVTTDLMTMLFWGTR